MESPEGELRSLHCLGGEMPPGTRIILRALVGSTVHGTSVSNTDDRDETAVGIPPADYVVGLKVWQRESSVYRTQPEGVRSGPGDLDLTIHSLRKYAKLAATGNPTILLPLFVPEQAIVSCDWMGVQLRTHRNIFLSKKCGQSFLGYLHEQKQRLLGDRGQMRVTRTELIEAYGFDTKYAGHIVRLAYQGIELMSTGTLSLPMRAAERETVVNVRTGKHSLEQVLQLADLLEQELRAAINKTLLPEEPDLVSIDELLVSLYLNAWRI